ATGDTPLAGSHTLTGADRLVTGPDERVELSRPGAGQPHPAVHLEGGVVHGGGLVGDLSEDAASRPFAGEARPLGGERAAATPLTSEMPSTGVYTDPELVPQSPPPAERPQVPMAPYPLSGPDQSAVQGPQSSSTSGPQPSVQGPPSGPQPPVVEPSPYLPASEPPPLPVEPQPGPFPSFDEPAPAGNGAGPETFDQPSPHFDPVTPFDQGPPREQPFDQPGPPPFDQPGPPPFDQPVPPPQEQPDHGDRPLVYGVDCKNDHFNDPRVPYCAVCGIALVQRTLVPYKGPRPSLGVLVLDDGTTLTLESDYLLGRDPERAPEVAGGSARPAKVTSPDGSVSRRHLRVALDGWDVNLVDLGSVNGTQIQPPGDPNFYDIPPNEPVTIAPGTTVRVGVSRTLRFEAHRS
ncbi:FHA domain-containing protein, partial [Nonomuraea sp. NPDC005983]|uniref:FHA domain-containing protein n=1 Tax=Nonomuraea sp. NPDC005983 TaxID=3155595 RepID=UPI0033B10B9B